MPGRPLNFCQSPVIFSRAATASDGCAPTPSQYWARSEVTSMSDGLLLGLVEPDLLDDLAVALLARVDDDDAVLRHTDLAHALQTDLDGHVWVSPRKLCVMRQPEPGGDQGDDLGGSARDRVRGTGSAGLSGRFCQMTPPPPKSATRARPTTGPDQLSLFSSDLHQFAYPQSRETSGCLSPPVPPGVPSCAAWPPPAWRSASHRPWPGRPPRPGPARRTSSSCPSTTSAGTSSAATATRSTRPRTSTGWPARACASPTRTPPRRSAPRPAPPW